MFVERNREKEAIKGPIFGTCPLHFARKWTIWLHFIWLCFRECWAEWMCVRLPVFVCFCYAWKMDGKSKCQTATETVAAATANHIFGNKIRWTAFWNRSHYHFISKHAINPYGKCSIIIWCCMRDCASVAQVHFRCTQSYHSWLLLLSLLLLYRLLFVCYRFGLPSKCKTHITHTQEIWWFPMMFVPS